MTALQQDLFVPPPAAVGDIPAQPTETDIRILGMRKARWIPYQVGDKVLRQLGQMVDGPPSHRPPCLLIYGDTNNGKTLIIRKFAKLRNGAPVEDTDQLIRPVVVVSCPPYTGIRGLAARVLEQLNAPVPLNLRVERLMEQMQFHMRNAGVRMLAVDEIQHLLGIKYDRRMEYFNTLKDLGNILEIPIVLVGTLDAVRAVQSDPQLGNRFEARNVPRWQNTEDYARFLFHLCFAMRLQETSNWGSRALVSRFHTMSEGLTGESWKLMCQAAEVAVRTGRELIDEEVVAQVDWVRPSDRRRVA